MLSNYGWGLPVGASTHAKDIDFGLYLIHGAMVLMFVLWGIFFGYLLIRYRRKKNVPAEREKDHGVWRGLLPDIVVLIFEILLIAFYAIPVWSRIKMSAPQGPAVRRMFVMAEQFAWNVHYPGTDGVFGRRIPHLITFSNPMGLDASDPASQDDVVLANELHMAVNVPLQVDLTSKDVVHSFFVPEFRVKQDIVPGLKTSVWFEPTLEGKFELACAQLCGFGHTLMRGDVFVHTPEAFEKWMSEQKTFGGAP